MKRWNQKGSSHAVQRMSELRRRKDRLATRRLQSEFCRMAGIKTADELRAALQSAIGRDPFVIGATELDFRAALNEAIAHVSAA